MTVNIYQQVNEDQAIHAFQTIESHVAASVIQAVAVNLVATQIAAVITIGAQVAASQTKSNAEAPTPMALEQSKTIPTKETSDQKKDYTKALLRSYMQAQIEEILAQLEELERTGYANWMIVQLIIGKLNAYATELRQDVIDPLKGLQDIDKAHSKLKAVIEKMQAKKARGEDLTEEDAKEFANAVTELESAVNKALEKLPERKEGEEPTAYEELILRLKDNVEMILDQGIGNPGDTIRDNLDSPEKLLGALNTWAQSANAPSPHGPFVEWNEGSTGLTTLRLELQSMVTEFSDRLNRDSQLITSLNSMAQKHIELMAALLRTLTANQISR